MEVKWMGSLLCIVFYVLQFWEDKGGNHSVLDFTLFWSSDEL
jgi:hypothetical protein